MRGWWERQRQRQGLDSQVSISRVQQFDHSAQALTLTCLSSPSPVPLSLSISCSLVYLAQGPFSKRAFREYSIFDQSAQALTLTCLSSPSPVPACRAVGRHSHLPVSPCIPYLLPLLPACLPPSPRSHPLSLRQPFPHPLYLHLPRTLPRPYLPAALLVPETSASAGRGRHEE